jgi:hypothetical protein
MRRLFRWAFRVVLGLIVLVVLGAVAFILLLDTLAREAVISRLRSRTGMDVKVASVQVGLLSPTFSIEGLKLYNTVDFGGSLCLDMPELHAEYDRAAFRNRQLHLALLRLDLAELDVVIDKHDRMNFDTLRHESQWPNRRKTAVGNLRFTKIDVLNVSLGRFHLTNQASGKSEEVDFGIKNQILRNVKTSADLSALGLAALPRGQSSGARAASLDLPQVIEDLLASP